MPQNRGASGGGEWGGQPGFSERMALKLRHGAGRKEELQVEETAVQGPEVGTESQAV